MAEDREDLVALVVDDSSLARMLIRNLIKNAFPQWTILETKSADEALASIEETVPAVVLVDYNMPGMNGLDLALKILDKHPAVQAYLVTANIQGKMQERAEAAGIGFITKPVSVEKLQKALAVAQK